MDSGAKTSDFKLFLRIFTYTKPYKRILYSTITTTIILAALSPLRPWLIQYTFDNYVSKMQDQQMLLNITIILVALVILEAFLQFIDTYLSNSLGQSIIKDIRVKLYGHILDLKLKFFDNTAIGTLVTRVVSDIETIADIFSQGLLIIIGDLLKLTVVIGVMFYTDVKLTLVSLAIIPLLLLATNIFKNAIKASYQEVRTQVSALNAFVQEHITGMNIVQIFNREKIEHEKFTEINQRHTDANIRSIWHYSVFFPIVEILSAVSLGLIVWWGGKGVLQQTSTIGEIIAFIMYTNILFRPIRQLADRFNVLQMGMVSSERVFKIMDSTERIYNKGTIHAGSIKGKIEFKNVWFAYNDEQWILRNVSFTVNEGETVAIVGATGAGKSSIINVLGRFYEYNKGVISIDGVNIRDFDLNSLRKKIAIVLQDAFLFSDTIANNITLNDKSISFEQVQNSAMEVHAHEFINKLPGKYNYDVKERGGRLSTGQRQLVAFIRAYITKPKILILDEATSSIDTESEKLIQYATDKLTSQSTSIIIAHRLATIQKADKIIVLEKGEIIEMGNHQELLHINGHYKKLFELQFKHDK